MKKSFIKVEVTELKSNKYFEVHNVFAIRQNGEKHLLRTYLNKDDAVEYKEFAYEYHSDLYKTIFIVTEICWC